ncbi:hypothetical protein F5X96DRAFT_618083 [Biscogniauxia mediterranea]|nr:hypothetical protein F5X96DRAFT_618083 [Biscogniauxia mediterranea]
MAVDENGKLLLRCLSSLAAYFHHLIIISSSAKLLYLYSMSLEKVPMVGTTLLWYTFYMRGGFFRYPLNPNAVKLTSFPPV